MRLRTLSVKVPAEIAEKIALIGHTLSIQTRTRHTPSSILRQLIEKAIATNETIFSATDAVSAIQS